jgi:hypothetical protein
VAVNSIEHLLFLINTTATNLLEVFICLAFRSNSLEETIRKNMLNDLQDKNLDVSQLVDFRVVHCQQA